MKFTDERNIEFKSKLIPHNRLSLIIFPRNLIFEFKFSLSDY